MFNVSDCFLVSYLFFKQLNDYNKHDIHLNETFHLTFKLKGE